MQEESKFCKDCRFVVWHIPVSNYECRNPELCDTDLVLGVLSSRNCYAERSASGKCGRAGNYFKEQE